MKTIATYTCKEHDITCDSEEVNVTGKVMFISGMLARVTDSSLLEYKRTALMGTSYNVHKILSFDHITNEA